MSAFVLKLIAIFSMLLDHSGYIIFNGISFFNYIGRFAFPIFAFQISEGYIHTKNVKKYLLRLTIFAFVSQIPYMLFHSLLSDTFSLNVMFTLLIGLLGIICYDKISNKFLGILCCILLTVVAQYVYVDYGSYGVAIIILFYIFKNKIILMPLSFILATFIRYFIYFIQFGYSDILIYLWSFATVSIVFISSYNEKKGKDTKYLLYLFYPVHLLILYLISFY